MLNDVNRIQFIIEFVVILIGLIAYNVGLINKGEGSKLLIKISNIVVILAGISILCYLIFTVFKIIPPSSQMFYLWGGAREIPNYYNIYYVTQPITIHGMRFIRNTGIFTEAPMYAFMLTISVMCELFVRKNIKKVNLAILIVTTGLYFGEFVSPLILQFLSKTLNIQNVTGSLFGACIVCIVALLVSIYAIISDRKLVI